MYFSGSIYGRTHPRKHVSFPLLLTVTLQVSSFYRGGSQGIEKFGHLFWPQKMAYKIQT